MIHLIAVRARNNRGGSAEVETSSVLRNVARPPRLLVYLVVLLVAGAGISAAATQATSRQESVSVTPGLADQIVRCRTQDDLVVYAGLAQRAAEFAVMTDALRCTD